MSSRSLPRAAPRARSVGRRDEDDHRSATRSHLPPAPRMPPSQNPRPQGRPQSSRDRTGDTRALSSTSASSESSFLERMKMRSEPSSSASMKNDEERPKRNGDWAPARRQARQAVEEEDSTPSNETTSGYGYDLWGRVTAVAGNLTVNVSKAWQTSIHVGDGEETPPGDESRLTKAMKAYHLDRARSPADLPAWLFDEHERGVARRPWSAKSEEYEERSQPNPEAGQQSGLRSIYDRAAPALPKSRQEDATGQGGSRATNRLKAIREAKRSALQSRSEGELRRGEDEESRRSDERDAASLRARGLPAGPGRSRINK